MKRFFLSFFCWSQNDVEVAILERAWAFNVAATVVALPHSGDDLPAPLPGSQSDILPTTTGLVSPVPVVTQRTLG